MSYSFSRNTGKTRNGDGKPANSPATGSGEAASYCFKVGWER
jgi:hypothetical protein